MKKQVKAAAALTAALIMALSTAMTSFAETGWVQRGNAWYYYHADGSMATNQWVKSNSGLFWIQPDGTMGTNMWVKNGDNWYYVDGSGESVTGWHEIGGKWYYFYRDFTMASDTLIDSYKVGKDGAWIAE